MVGLLLAGGGAWAVWGSDLFGGQPRYRGLTETVRKETLVLRVIERGELESANNNDIICRVKPRKNGGSVTIKDVIEDGTYVQKGDVLVELDASPLETDLKEQQIVVDQAQAAWVAADQTYQITVSQNQSDILAAQTILNLAKLDEEKYRDGEYFLAFNDIKKRFEEAQSNYKLWQERLAWSQRMAIKGYVSKAQRDSDAAKELSAALALRNVEKEMHVLEQFTKKRTMEDLKSKRIEAERALERVNAKAKSLEIQADTDRKTKKSIFDQELAKKQEIEDEISKCVIRAPQAGLVVYYMSQQSKYSRGSSQSIVAPNEPVSYNQKLMQIPDLSNMIVKARVPEAMVAYLRNADPDNPSSAQKAFVRVDAHAEEVLPGHVEAVATIASQQDWFSSDVKVYETRVAIDKVVNKLKPGMSAEVTIVAYESKEPVLTIPIHCVVGTITMGRSRKCFVIDENGYGHERDIVLGMSNNTVVEVKSGLKEGEKVAAEPGSLIPEDSALTPASAGKNRGVNAGDVEGGKGEKGKGDPRTVPGGRDDAPMPGSPGQGSRPLGDEAAKGTSPAARGGAAAQEVAAGAQDRIPPKLKTKDADGGP